MKDWLLTARQPKIYRRSIKVALIVGTILVLINYFDKILSDALTSTDFFKMGLTYIVPFCVSTYAAVSATRENA